MHQYVTVGKDVVLFNFLIPQVSYRDVPGIDHAYLAMDTEEGVEVVWNEAMFSETKRFKVCLGTVCYITRCHTHCCGA